MALKNSSFSFLLCFPPRVCRYDGWYPTESSYTGLGSDGCCLNDEEAPSDSLSDLDSGCQDSDNELCGVWAEEGLCVSGDYYAFMSSHCPLSCGQCGGENSESVGTYSCEQEEMGEMPYVDGYVCAQHAVPNSV